METGHIRITDKVYFEYYKLPKPNREDYPKYQERYSDAAQDTVLNLLLYKEALKEYEASKRTVEVSNKYFVKTISPYNLYVHIKDIDTFIKNNQPCKAEVKNDKATIIELTK